MDPFEFVAVNSPITNITQFFGHAQGTTSMGVLTAELIFIIAVVGVMEYFLHQIRWHQKPQYYPQVFVLFTVATAALYFYCFQGGFPVMDGHSCICWFTNHKLIGWGWAIVGIIFSIAVLYIMLCALQQICAQLQMYSDSSLVSWKPWKEWKIGVSIAMLSITLAIVGLWIKPITASWMFISGQILLFMFVYGKIVADCVRTKKILWSILIGLVFYIGITPICIISADCASYAYLYIVAIWALFTESKSRKKEPKKVKAAK